MTHYHHHLPEATGKPEDPAVWIKPGEPDEEEKEQLEGICLGDPGGTPGVDPELHEFNRINARVARATFRRDEVEGELREAREAKNHTRIKRIEEWLDLIELEYRAALTEYEKMVPSEGGEE